MVAPDSAERPPATIFVLTRGVKWRKGNREVGVASTQTYNGRPSRPLRAWLGLEPRLHCGTSRHSVTRRDLGLTAGHVWMAGSHGIGARSHARVSGSADSNIHRVPVAVADARLQLRRPVERSDTVRGCPTSIGCPEEHRPRGLRQIETEIGSIRDRDQFPTVQNSLFDMLPKNIMDGRCDLVVQILRAWSVFRPNPHLSR